QLNAAWTRLRRGAIRSRRSGADGCSAPSAAAHPETSAKSLEICAFRESPVRDRSPARHKSGERIRNRECEKEYAQLSGRSLGAGAPALMLTACFHLRCSNPDGAAFIHDHQQTSSITFDFILVLRYV